MRELSAELPDDAATAALAARVGAAVDGGLVAYLHGPLGAGKSSFARALLQSMGVAGRIKSPTYAVVEPYEVPGLAIWHFDFYRFTDPREWEDAGFRDLFGGPGLKLAEWPENAAALLPKADLSLRIEVEPDESRLVTLVAQTPAGRELLP